MDIVQAPVPTKIFHMTCISNLPLILTDGELKSKNRLDQSQIDSKYRNIAYDDVQNRRKNTIVPIAPGGNLHDYVPFYFAPRSPMLDAIRRGKVKEFNGDQDDLCYLVSDAQKINDHQLNYVFSSGHAIMQPLEFFNSLDNLNKIEWEIFLEDPLVGDYAQFWQDRVQEDKPKWVDRKRRRQAEFLIFRHLPWEFISGIATRNESKKTEVQSILKQHKINTPVIVQPEWYYD